MRLTLLVALLFIAGAADAQLKERSDAAPLTDQTGGLVDEDEDLLPTTTYAFNPIQAKKDLQIGDFYAKKGNSRAAAGRYLEATRWNPQYAEAYWKLAGARDELGQNSHALDAYRSYLALEPNGKQAKQAQARIEQLVAALESPPLAAEDTEKTEGP